MMGRSPQCYIPIFGNRPAGSGEEDPIKIQSTRELTSLKLDFFSDAQGQLSRKSEVEFRRNSNLSKLLLLSSFTARMKMIRLKMKALEC